LEGVGFINPYCGAAPHGSIPQRVLRPVLLITLNAVKKQFVAFGIVPL
jgi:hypothetical protein